MRASKESARKANADLEEAAIHLDKCMTAAQRGSKDHIKRCLIRVQGFIDAAEVALPSEAAYMLQPGRKK